MEIIRLNELGDADWVRENELICLSNYEGLTLTHHRDYDDTYWLIKFGKVLAYNNISEEFSLYGYLRNVPNDGSYFEILDSPWMKEFNNEEILSKCKHCVYYFYDDVVEVIAQEFIYEQLRQKPIIKYEWEILKKGVT